MTRWIEKQFKESEPTLRKFMGYHLHMKEYPRYDGSQYNFMTRASSVSRKISDDSKKAALKIHNRLKAAGITPDEFFSSIIVETGKFPWITKLINIKVKDSVMRYRILMERLDTEARGVLRDPLKCDVKALRQNFDRFCMVYKLSDGAMGLINHKDVVFRDKVHKFLPFYKIKD